MLLSHVLRKENNNLDIFRVVAAAMVIFGHAYALLPVEGTIDPIGRILSFDYSGSLAVKVFFFLSGLVVTNSLILNKNIRLFIISRFFRIWPALIVTLIGTAFILGPIISSLSPQEYFSSKQSYVYFLSSLLMKIRYYLPGVFQNNAMSSVNGSLWSIPFEVFAYILLAIIYWSGILKYKVLIILLFALILIDPIIGNKILFIWLPQNSERTMLAPCFATGALLALFKDKIKINIQIFLISWIIYFLFKNSYINFYFFYFAIFYSILFLSSRNFLIKLKPSVDISYGLYLWGWPVQQVMAQSFPEYGLKFNQGTSIIISAALGLLSWHLIEKHFIRIGATLGKNKKYSKKPIDASTAA